MHRRELRRMLATYDPHTPDELVAITRFRALLDRDGDIFCRGYFVPGHVTASAVVISSDGDEIALVDHIKLGVWLQPGGHVEPTDSSLTNAATREVVEECGPLELRSFGLFDIDVHDIPAFGDEPPHLHFDVRVLCKVTGGDLENTGEVNDVRWFAFDRPPAPLGFTVDRLLSKAGVLKPHDWVPKTAW